MNGREVFFHGLSRQCVVQGCGAAGSSLQTVALVQSAAAGIPCTLN